MAALIVWSWLLARRLSSFCDVMLAPRYLKVMTWSTLLFYIASLQRLGSRRSRVTGFFEQIWIFYTFLLPVRTCLGVFIDSRTINSLIRCRIKLTKLRNVDWFGHLIVCVIRQEAFVFSRRESICITFMIISRYTCWSQVEPFNYSFDPVHDFFRKTFFIASQMERFIEM